MNQFSRILFHMHLMNADFFLSRLRINLHISVSRDRKIELGDLVVLRVIRIEIILPVEFTHLCNLTICGKSERHGILYHLFIKHRK